MTEKADVMLLLTSSDKCSTDDWTCEANSQVSVQCNAHAHSVSSIKVYAVECESIDKCYRLRQNPPPAPIRKHNNHKKKKISLNDYDDNEDEIDEEESNSSNSKMKMLDASSSIWSIKTNVSVNRLNLVVCAVSNDMGLSVSTKLILVHFRPHFKNDKFYFNCFIYNSNISFKAVRSE